MLTNTKFDGAKAETIGSPKARCVKSDERLVEVARKSRQDNGKKKKQGSINDKPSRRVSMS